MASRLIGCRSRVVAYYYMPNLEAAVKHFRAFSSYDERQPSEEHPSMDSSMLDDHSDTVWPDMKLGPFGAQDKRFLLPGLVGTNGDVKSPLQMASSQLKELPDILTVPSPHQRQIGMFHQYLAATKELPAEDEPAELASKPSPADSLECAVSECPILIRKDFQDLFPDRNLAEGTLSVITISRKTENDMSGWSPEVEEEREILLENFVHGAEDICTALHQAGYWADFIDPSSGRPYLGTYTNATLFETDDRYRYFGFRINDLGCCKVIAHHLWGTKCYVGCLFTNAPADHPVLRAMIKKN